MTFYDNESALTDVIARFIIFETWSMRKIYIYIHLLISKFILVS